MSSFLDQYKWWIIGGLVVVGVGVGLWLWYRSKQNSEKEKRKREEADRAYEEWYSEQQRRAALPAEQPQAPQQQEPLPPGMGRMPMEISQRPGLFKSGESAMPSQQPTEAPTYQPSRDLRGPPPPPSSRGPPTQDPDGSQYIDDGNYEGLDDLKKAWDQQED
jgi:hypothetical protein